MPLIVDDQVTVLREGGYAHVQVGNFTCKVSTPLITGRVYTLWIAVNGETLPFTHISTRGENAAAGKE